MSLVETAKAIRKVTDLLCFNLENLLKNEYGIELNVKAGRPEPVVLDDYKKRLNLFLFEASFDPSLKNVTIQEGFPEPLWLVLHFLLTAYDDGGDSDTPQSYEYLGEGIRGLQQLNFLKLSASAMAALSDNPEPLKITFNHASSELLSKLMQGSDEKYRFSMAFEVRPVMIATTQPPAGTLLVGIDYGKTPPQPIIKKEKGVHIPVLPSMGPEITGVSPVKFEVNDTITITGNYFSLAGCSVLLGAAELEIADLTRDRLQVKVNGAVAAGTGISAGSLPLKVREQIGSGRFRSSALWAGSLLPTLDSAVIDAGTLALEAHPFEAGKQVIEVDLTLTGKLLGTDKDDIIISFYKDGKVQHFVEVVGVDPTDPPPIQTQLKVEITKDHKIFPGIYRLILTVNGQQAKSSPQLDLEVP